MQQLGLVLTEDDIHAMMKSAGIGPHGKISYAGISLSLIQSLSLFLSATHSLCLSVSVALSSLVPLVSLYRISLFLFFISLSSLFLSFSLSVCLSLFLFLFVCLCLSHLIYHLRLVISILLPSVCTSNCLRQSHV